MTAGRLLSALVGRAAAFTGRSSAPVTLAAAADGCNPTEGLLALRPGVEPVEVPASQIFDCLDVLCPDHAPWLPDLASAVVPELVIRIPLEGVPRWRFEDGRGGRVTPTEPMMDWLWAARCMGTMYVTAGNIVEIFAAYDADRLEGNQPGRLFQGDE